MTNSPPEFAELTDEEEEITVQDELLYRQITEPLWDSVRSQPASTSFAPNSFDEDKPSFSRSSKVSAQDSRDWHNKNAKKPSLGVWACSVQEIVESGSRAIDDSAVPTSLAPGHAYVDYRNLAKGDARILRSLLLAHALARQEIPTAS